MSSFDDGPSDRAKRYLALAAAAHRRAERTTDPRLAQSYTTIAMGWEALALQTEQQSNPPRGAVVPIRPALRSV